MATLWGKKMALRSSEPAGMCVKLSQAKLLGEVAMCVIGRQQAYDVIGCSVILPWYRDVPLHLSPFAVGAVAFAARSLP